MKKNVICLLILLIISMFLIAMPILAEDQAVPPQTLTVQQLKEDTDFFFKTIEDTHPNIYYKLSKEDYDNYKKLSYSKINRPMSVEEYWKILAEFLNKFGDGHTEVYNPIEASNKKVSPPFVTDWIDGHLVITKVFGNFPIKKGDVILYINDISVQEWLDSKLKYISYNDYQWARRQTSTSEFGINFISEPKHMLTINSADNKIFKWDCPLFDLNNKMFEDCNKGGAGTYSFSSGKKEKYFNFYFWNDLNIGYLDWNQCVDRKCIEANQYFNGEKADPAVMNKIPNFSAMLEKSFKQLNSNNSKYFIVDVRGNGGGYSVLIDQFFNYVTDRDIKGFRSILKLSNLYKEQWGKEGFSKYILSKLPLGTVIDGEKWDKLDKEYSKLSKKNKNEKTYQNFFVFPKIKDKFKGKIILLIDSLDFSGGEWVALFCRDNNIGILVGEPTGGGVTCPASYLYFNPLPNSKIAGQISSTLFIRADQFRVNERAVYPDYYVYQTIEDFRAGKDTVLEFVKQGIKENKF